MRNTVDTINNLSRFKVSLREILNTQQYTTRHPMELCVCSFLQNNNFGFIYCSSFFRINMIHPVIQFDSVEKKQKNIVTLSNKSIWYADLPGSYYVCNKEKNPKAYRIVWNYGLFAVASHFGSPEAYPKAIYSSPIFPKSTFLYFKNMPDYKPLLPGMTDALKGNCLVVPFREKAAEEKRAILVFMYSDKRITVLGSRIAITGVDDLCCFIKKGKTELHDFLPQCLSMKKDKNYSFLSEMQFRNRLCA